MLGYLPQEFGVYPHTSAQDLLRHIALLKGITDRLMKRFGLHYRRGLYDIGSHARRSTLYVTPGVGFSGVTRRHGEGTHAEVAVLTLRMAPPRVAKAA